jgi:hypothetical protein
MSTQEIINIGALPNDGEGDPLRTAFQKINNNFSKLFGTYYDTLETYTVGNTASQVIFTTSASTFTQAQFQINSSNPNTQDSQNILIKVSKNNNGLGVNWVGYGTSFNVNAVTRYDVVITSGNVNVTASPLTTDSLRHFISYQVTWVGGSDPGIDIALDGYPTGDLLGTENLLIMTTE